MTNEIHRLLIYIINTKCMKTQDEINEMILKIINPMQLKCLQQTIGTCSLRRAYNERNLSFCEFANMVRQHLVLALK